MKRILPFAKFGNFTLILSILITSSLLAITVYRGGFNLGIDFKSGLSIELEVQGANAQDIKSLLAQKFENVQVTPTGNAGVHSFNIKMAASVENQEKNVEELLVLLQKTYTVNLLSSAFIGSGISQQLFKSVLILTSGALLLILLYVWLRFKIHFAVSALLALVHDVFFIIGIVGAFQIEVSTSTIAAILTIIGYSLNDTIVIFDRMRENISLIRDAPFKRIVDISVTQTLSRTTITSFTTLLAILALMFFATGDVYNFARTLIIGIVEGTWSSIFIASPVLCLLNKDKILRKERTALGSGAEDRLRKLVLANGETVETSSNTRTQLDNTKATKQEIKQADIQSEIDRVRAEVLSKQQKKHKKRR